MVRQEGCFEFIGVQGLMLGMVVPSAQAQTVGQWEMCLLSRGKSSRHQPEKRLEGVRACQHHFYPAGVPYYHRSDL